MHPEQREEPDSSTSKPPRRALRVLIVSLSTYSSGFNDGKLAELGNQVDELVAVAADRPTLWGIGGESRDSVAYRVRVLKTRLGGRNATALLRGLDRVARGTRPTLIHVECEPWQGVAVQSILLARKLGVPAGVQFAENGPMLRGPGGLVRVAVARWVLSRCRYAIGWSSESASIARKLAPGLQVETYPGTGVSEMRGVRSGPDSSAFWFGTSAPGAARLAFVGRFSAEKGLKEFLDAVDALATRVSIRVAIAGGSPSHPLLQDWLISRPWAKAHGVLPRPRVAELLAASDVLVSPSRTLPHVKEQFGLVPLEAMALGKPVFGFDCGALSELIGDGGVVVPEGQVDDLVRELERYLRAPTARKEALSMHARAQAAHYTDGALAAGLVRIWSDLPN